MNTMKVINPRSGQADYEIPDHDEAYVAARAAELKEAQREWTEKGLEYRCRVLAQWRDVLPAYNSAIAAAACIDTGRHLMSQIETSTTPARINHWIEYAPKIMAQIKAGTSSMSPSVRYHYQMVPYPVVGIISPWNVPLILALIDAIPALLAGSAVLLKPSEVTPRFAAPLAESIAEIPELAAVLKIVTGGAATGMAMIDNVNAICFTGSVATGRKVAVQAAQNFIPAFLELGGKDPAVVLPTADLDNATNAILRSAAGLTGQACQSLERIYVHHSIYEPFLDLLVAKARQIKFNWPDIHQGQIGPFIFPEQAHKVREQLEDAVAHGARIHCGGEIQELGGGMYCLPTVITGVNHDMQLMREETFGPVLPVMQFETTEQAIAMANDTDFGLSAAVFCGDLIEGEAVAAQIVAGAVSINDAGLTAVVNDVEKNSFCLSGMGGSRMGDGGFLRFFRKRAIMVQSAPATSMESLDEALAG